MFGTLRFAAVAATTLIIGCAQTTTTTESTAETSAEETPSVVFTDATTLEISVPEMMCPHGCYPGVKKALEAQPNVASVELGTPAEAETNQIEDRRVIVTTSGPVDVTAAVSAFPAHLQKGVDVQEIEPASGDAG